MSKKIFIKTFGCQMNEYDSDRILDTVKSIGYEQTKKISEADCYVLNTCHIREKATDKVYHDVGRVKKEFRNKKKPILIIAGCVAQAEGDILLKREKYIDSVIGPQSYHKVPSIIKNIEKNRTKFNITEFDVVEKFDRLSFTKNSNSKISSFLTIQEGCDKFCKFCVVPYTRGPEYSRPYTQIISEAEQLISNGVKEITLLGQNVNAYNSKGKKLSDLIKTLNKNENLKRIRYTTSHPNDVTNDLVNVHANCKKLMPLLHLPVQSGSSKVLKAMNRKHDIERYYEIINQLKIKNKKLKFSSDFIIGYPGETDNDFNKTIDLMKNVKFINSYSFIYSQRPGTPAANLDSIDENIAKKRLEIFQKISNDIKKKYRKSLLGVNSKVLFENKINNENKYFGRDEYYNSVIVNSDEDITGKELEVKIQEFNHNTLFGELLTRNKQEYAAA